MIKDVMVYLDGSAADDMRLAAVDDIATLFRSHIIGLFLNPIPLLAPVDGGTAGALRPVDPLHQAIENGNTMEAALAMRLARLEKPVKLRRFDVFADDVADIAAREARSADTFVALRPNGELQEPERLVEGVLFGSGRHLILVPDGERSKGAFDRVLIAWDGSRESARALAEAMPFLHKAEEVTIVIVGGETAIWNQSMAVADAVNHLKHHGIDAVVERAAARKRDVGAKLIAEAERRKTDLLVMGGYGHSRLRERLLGGVTYELLHEAPVPLLVAR
jgi:nucleotide-binding universal stress UspA family protein